MTLALADYNGMLDAIRDNLTNNPLTAGLLRGVHVSWHGEPNPDMLPCALVYLHDRRIPVRKQTISAGMRTDLEIVFSVWVLHYSLNSMDEAVRLRNDLLARVDAALMSDRTLGNRARGVWLEAGNMVSGANEQGAAFSAGAETRLVADTSTTL